MVPFSRGSRRKKIEGKSFLIKFPPLESTRTINEKLHVFTVQWNDEAKNGKKSFQLFFQTGRHYFIFLRPHRQNTNGIWKFPFLILLRVSLTSIEAEKPRMCCSHVSHFFCRDNTKSEVSTTVKILSFASKLFIFSILLNSMAIEAQARGNSMSTSENWKSIGNKQQKKLEMIQSKTHTEEIGIQKAFEWHRISGGV